MILSLALVVASLGAQPTPSPSAPPMPQYPPCDFGQPARLVERMAALPAPVRAELERLFATANGIAEAGAFFESSDAYSGNPPTARFIRAYFVADTWFVWFERGGIGVERNVVALAETDDRDTRTRVVRAVPGSLISTNLCAGSKAFLTGARSVG